MRHALKVHPDAPSAAVLDISVDLLRPNAGSLMLHYVVSGDIGALHMPPRTAAGRADELWQHTCFEAFIGTAAGAGYYEFNFSPSTQWAAYWLDGYRSGLRAASEVHDPRIEVQSSATRYSLKVMLDLGALSRLPRDARWRLGLSALIEDASGRKSYWALAHPPGKPDFHHSVCFAHGLS